MGRELKRVPLDFDWPQDKRWKGYINPFYDHQIKCPHCESGYSAEYRKLERRWYGYDDAAFTPEQRGSTPYLPDGPQAIAWATRQIDRDDSGYYQSYGRLSRDEAIKQEAIRICGIWNSHWSHHLNEQDVAALFKADRLWDFTRVVKPGTRKNAAKWPNGWLKKNNGYVPTPREVNEWSLMGFGHDSTNAWIVIKAELKRFKQPSTCAHCKGQGDTWPTDKLRRQCAAWKRKGPPEGDGYQVWETVSEGSPISPVFATPQELANHMSTTRWGGDEGSSPETWLRFILGPGWAPSMMSSPQTGLISGVEAVVALEGKP